jgi:hypothetical protein
MTTEQRQILDELQQICEQYRREMPSKRKPWPESIRERIFQLRDLGLSFHTISVETGIPAMTLYSWGPDGKTRKRRKRGGAFLPVKVVEAATPTTVTVKHDTRPPPEESRRSLGTVTIVLTTGIRVEGLDVASAADLLRRLS